jgi:lysophospholipase L1-like esterase
MQTEDSVPSDTISTPGDVGLDTDPQRKIPLKRRIVYLSIVYLAFVLLLVAIEVITRLTLPHLSSLELFINTPQQKAQITNQQQATIFEGDPLLLWRLKPNLDHVVWDFTVVTTNSQGLRLDYPLNSKAAGTFRILCVGDSVTFGYRVPVVWPERPKDYNPDWLPFPMLIEKELRAANPGRKIEVIALAVPGYSSYQGLAQLRREIDRLQPDLVTICFGWNDVSMSDYPDRETIPTNWRAVTVRWLIDHSQAFAHATHWLRSKRQSSGNTAPRQPAPRVSQQQYLSNIQEMVRLAGRHGAPAIVIAAPYRDRITNPVEAASMIAYRESLRSAMQQDGTTYLELPQLTEAGYPANRAVFGELIHPNHMGHRLIAAELLKLLGAKGAIKDLTVPMMNP